MNKYEMTCFPWFWSPKNVVISKCLHKINSFLPDMLSILLCYYENNVCSSIVSFDVPTNILICHIYFITILPHEVVELKVDRKN